MKFVKALFLGREPALAIGFVSAVLGVLASVGFHSLTPTLVGLIVAALNAAVGAVQAVFTRPIGPSAFTTLVGVGFALAAGLGYHASPELIGTVDGLVIAFLSLVTRQQVSPMLAVRAAAGK